MATLRRAHGYAGQGIPVPPDQYRAAPIFFAPCWSYTYD